MIAGDQVAWIELIDRHGGLIRARVCDVAASMGRRHDEPLVDDVTAEVFAALIANDSAALRAFQGRSELATYLAVIATRVARRVIGRVVTRVDTTPDESVSSRVDLSSPDPANSAMTAEERQRLLELVDHLPDSWRRLVLAYYRDQMTYAEMSERWGVPVGSIGTTLRRAEAKLRGWIEGGFHGD